MLISALMMAAALTGTDPDGVVATAPTTPVTLDAEAAQPESASPEGVARSRTQTGLATDQQINSWIAARDPHETPYSRGRVESVDDRKMHGVVDVGLGTGGYQSFAAAVSMPLGDSGRLDISVSRGRNDRRWGYYDPTRFDYGGYIFPDATPRDIAASAYEERVARPEGPPRLWPRSEPDRRTQ